MVQPEYRAVASAPTPLDLDLPAVRGRVQASAWSLSKLGWPLLWVAFFLLLVFPTVSFLLLAFSPRLFDQGTAWLTLSSFGVVLGGRSIHGLIDSVIVGVVAALVAAGSALALALTFIRTTVIGRGFWNICIWAILLMPSYLAVLGWESLLQPHGVLDQLGHPAPWLAHLFLGPVGVTLILAMKGTPFAYLAVSAALSGLGREFEDAARVHGAGPGAALRLIVPIIAPAVWSALAIVFAESISDFGVSSTLAFTSGFPMATYTLYAAIDNMPIQFPVASAVGWFLVAMAGGALLVQYRSLSGRSYAVLSGRTRPSSPRVLTPSGQAAALLGLIVFFFLALGIPLLGAVIASLLKGFGDTLTPDAFTLSNYQTALTSPDVRGPLLFSLRLAAIAATLAVLLGAMIARLLARRQINLAGRALDLLLLGAVALPGIVLAAGYIFAYNLPFFSAIGFTLYGTVTILAMAYLAGALPTTARLLAGPVAQIQASMSDAARVHGAGELATTLTIVVPLLARGLLWAWLLTFSGVMLELPVSQLLYPAGQQPLAVAITHHLANYDFAGGSAMTITAAAAMLLIIGVALAAFRLLVPAGWQRVRAR